MVYLEWCLSGLQRVTEDEAPLAPDFSLPVLAPDLPCVSGQSHFLSLTFSVGHDGFDVIEIKMVHDLLLLMCLGIRGGDRWLLTIVGNARAGVINEASDLRVAQDDDGALIHLDDGPGRPTASQGVFLQLTTTTETRRHDGPKPSSTRTRCQTEAGVGLSSNGRVLRGQATTERGSPALATRTTSSIRRRWPSSELPRRQSIASAMTGPFESHIIIPKNQGKCKHDMNEMSNVIAFGGLEASLYPWE